jgi:4-coumarate--CoA ligase
MKEKLHSGTTGKPKGLLIPHASVISNVLQMTEIRRSTLSSLEDKALLVLPLYHAYGLVVVLHLMIFNHVPIVVIPKFKFSHTLETICRYKINILFLVPPIVVLLTKSEEVDKLDLSFVKQIIISAAPISSEVIGLVKKKLPHVEIGQGYGLTEAGP